MGNDHEVKFQEIKSGFFQEIERTIEITSHFFQEIKSFIIFGTFFRRSKVKKALKSTFDFLKNLLVTSTIRRSKVDYNVFLTFNLL